MKIESNTPIRSANSVKNTKAKTGSSSFASQIGGADTPQSAAGVQPMIGVESIMSLQEVPDAMARKKVVRVRATKLLDHLEEIKMGLVLGAFSKQSLIDLKTLVDTKMEDFEDPHLKSIMEEIELRVYVELAKLEMNFEQKVGA